MKKSRGNPSQPRNAEGRFESKNQSSMDKSGAKPARSSGHMSNDRCRDDNGRYEKCDK